MDSFTFTFVPPRIPGVNFVFLITSINVSSQPYPSPFITFTSTTIPSVFIKARIYTLPSIPLFFTSIGHSMFL